MLTTNSNSESLRRCRFIGWALNQRQLARFYILVLLLYFCRQSIRLKQLKEKCLDPFSFLIFLGNRDQEQSMFWGVESITGQRQTTGLLSWSRVDRYYKIRNLGQLDPVIHGIPSPVHSSEIAETCQVQHLYKLLKACNTKEQTGKPTSLCYNDASAKPISKLTGVEFKGKPIEHKMRNLGAWLKACWQKLDLKKELYLRQVEIEYCIVFPVFFLCRGKRKLLRQWNSGVW